MSISCCLCGLKIAPNDANMCLECLKTELGMHTVEEKQMEAVQCGKCGRWHVRQDRWMSYDHESSELLAMLMRRVSSVLTATKIIDASWIWTEPHSRRMKINVDVERDVLDGKAQIRQKIVVEFIVKMKQCNDCIREAVEHAWETLVQVRQRVGHKRNLDSLEQTLIEGGYYEFIQDIVVVREGIDMYFKERQLAEKVIDFISCNFPTRTKSSKKLVSKDSKSNTAHCEYTIFLEVAPLCKGDLGELPFVFCSL